MVNIALVGCNGKMGKAVTSAAESRNDCKIIFGADPFGTPAYDYPVFEYSNLITKIIFFFYFTRWHNSDHRRGCFPTE